MSWFAVIGIFSVFITYMYKEYRMRRHTASNSEQNESARATPSLDETRFRVDAQLEEGLIFKVVAARRSRTENQWLSQLGPETRAFFARYHCVQTIRGGTVISEELVAPSSYLSGYISIGHSEDWDIIQAPGEDRIYVAEGAERSESDLRIEFPTVYDFIAHEISEMGGIDD